MAAEVERIPAEDAHEHLESNPETILVCAYDDQNKFAHNHLRGAMSLYEFQGLAGSLAKDREIIFYCA